MSDETMDESPDDDVVSKERDAALEELASESDELSYGVESPAAGEVYTNFRVMHVESILYDLGDASPFVHLMEAESPYRYLAIPLALADAVALHHAHNSVEGRRPSTSELTMTILTRLQAEIIAARIVRYEDGVYYAELDLMTPKGHEIFDCRTSDALTLALRQRVPAPILCAEEVLSLYLG
ncbi:MAG TPA: bifunctional nuclease domain-containing protein [Acidimicrobiales bacterium]|nr:bifunctional nuclease domain-containing protein [Acidimicrobiales bacterium]